MYEQQNHIYIYIYTHTYIARPRESEIWGTGGHARVLNVALGGGATIKGTIRPKAVNKGISSQKTGIQKSFGL